MIVRRPYIVFRTSWASVAGLLGPYPGRSTAQTALDGLLDAEANAVYYLDLSTTEPQRFPYFYDTAVVMDLDEEELALLDKLHNLEADMTVQEADVLARMAARGDTLL